MAGLSRLLSPLLGLRVGWQVAGFAEHGVLTIPSNPGAGVVSVCALIFTVAPSGESTPGKGT
jgi:hypothetical protein